MCVGGTEGEGRGDAGGGHESPAEMSNDDAAKYAHIMQYTPPGVKVAAHKYGDRVTKQEVRSAVEVSETSHHAKNGPPNSRRETTTKAPRPRSSFTRPATRRRSAYRPPGSSLHNPNAPSSSLGGGSSSSLLPAPQPPLVPPKPPRERFHAIPRHTTTTEMKLLKLK